MSPETSPASESPSTGVSSSTSSQSEQEISPETAVGSANTGESAESVYRPEPAFGWTAYAEQINGRFAMVGFVCLLLLELFTHQDLFTWLGLR